MSAKTRNYRVGAFLFIVLLLFAIIVAPVLAEGGTEPSPTPTISFVQEGDLVFGPPFPSVIDLAIKVKDVGLYILELKVQVISVTDEKGNNVFGSSIQTVPCDDEKETVQTNSKELVLTRRICLKTTNPKWGTYTAIVQATLSTIAQVTKTIKLVAGPEIPVTILNSEITVLGTSCPEFARNDTIKGVLCPNFEDFNLYIMGGTNLITITGYSGKDADKFKRFFQSASGTLISKEGAGTIIARLEPYSKEEDFTVCRPNLDRSICSVMRLRFWGVFKPGTYSGTFYLDTEDQSNDTMKVPITFMVKDHWLMPAVVILLGLATSAWITWQLDPRKKADKAIIEKRSHLEESREEFRNTVQNDGYFVADPDILTEVNLLLQASEKKPKDQLTTIGLSDLEKQMGQMVPLFVRFRAFYQLLYDLHEWEESHRAKLSTEKLASKIEEARWQMWIADSVEEMDDAQDKLIQALLIAHDTGRNDKDILETLPEFKVNQPSRHHVLQDEGPKFEIVPAQIAQWLIVLLSGIYVVYVTNPTFGTPQDYIYAFLWGSATNAGIEFVTKFFGTGILFPIPGVGK